MILNVSGRTDIIAFYSNWFMNRLEEGFIDVRNPFNPKLVSRIYFEDVDLILFCTKNPISILDKINKINKPILFHVTVTPYNKDIEPYVPSKKEIIDAVKKLSNIIGKENLCIRYDPIFLSNKYNVDYHIKAFDKLCSLLDGYVNTIIVSFIDDYKNVRNNRKVLNYREFNEEDYKIIGENFSRIAKLHNMTIQTCFEDRNLVEYGFTKGECLSHELAYKLTGKTYKNWTAKKRVKDYLGKDIEITYGGQIADIDEDNNWQCIPMEEVVNVDNTLGEYYIFTINGEDYEFFIEKNDSKMKNDVLLTTKDFITGSSITTSSSSVPLDSKIQYNLLDKNSVEYKELIEKLGLKMGLAADIKLFSNVKDSYITKLDDGTFKVYIAIDDDMNLADLKAYYLKDDGTKEIHDVTIENGYAVFETNHFSTYVLGSTTGISNPSTFDNVSLYVGLLLISMIGATGTVLCLKKAKIN